jgi:hypothetical protein
MNGGAGPLSLQEGLALSGRVGGYYCAGIAGLAASARVIGRGVVSASWEAGAFVLPVVLLILGWRGHAFSSFPRGVVAVGLAIVATVLFEFLALVVLVNVELLLGMGL